MEEPKSKVVQKTKEFIFRDNKWFLVPIRDNSIDSLELAKDDVWLRIPRKMVVDYITRSSVIEEEDHLSLNLQKVSFEGLVDLQKQGMFQSDVEEIFSMVGMNTQEVGWWCTSCYQMGLDPVPLLNLFISRFAFAPNCCVEAINDEEQYKPHPGLNTLLIVKHLRKNWVDSVILEFLEQTN